MSKQSTKIAIAQSLRGLLTEKPFEKISVDNICENAYVSRRNFYRHFSDKYALLNWLYYENYFSKITASDDWVIWDYLCPMCEQFYKDRIFFRNALQITGQNSLRAYCMELLYPIALKGERGVSFPKKLYKYYYIGLMGALVEYVLDWLKSEPLVPPEKFAENIRTSIASYSRHTWENSSKGI